MSLYTRPVLETPAISPVPQAALPHPQSQSPSHTHTHFVSDSEWKGLVFEATFRWAGPPAWSQGPGGGGAAHRCTRGSRWPVSSFCWPPLPGWSSGANWSLGIQERKRQIQAFSAGGIQLMSSGAKRGKDGWKCQKERRKDPAPTQPPLPATFPEVPNRRWLPPAGTPQGHRAWFKAWH